MPATPPERLGRVGKRLLAVETVQPVLTHRAESPPSPADRGQRQAAWGGRRAYRVTATTPPSQAGPLRGKMNAECVHRLEKAQVNGTQSDYYSVIVRAVAALDANTPKSRRALYNRARTVQATKLSGFEPPLSTEKVEIECEALEQAIRTVEAEAAAAEAEQTSRDAQIVLDFATFMTEMKIKTDCFYDLDTLPHPKEAIIAAIERGIVRSPLREHVTWLRHGATLLRNFQAGIGAEPLPFAGSDIPQFPQTSLDITQLKPAPRSSQNPSNAERAKEVEIMAEKESHEIEERVAAALRMRPTISGD